MAPSAKQLAIPRDREMFSGKAANAAPIKGIENQHGDRQIEKCKNKKSV